jgi:hypothetical protein
MRSADMLLGITASNVTASLTRAPFCNSAYAET